MVTNNFIFIPLRTLRNLLRTLRLKKEDLAAKTQSPVNH